MRDGISEGLEILAGLLECVSIQRDFRLEFLPFLCSAFRRNRRDRVHRNAMRTTGSGRAVRSSVYSHDRD